ncbi:VanZ family protein [Spirosoma fluminis]
MNTRLINKTKLVYYLAVGWTIVLFIGCSLPGNDLPDLSSNRDKWVHIAIFLPFGLLWRLAGRPVAWVFITGALYGLLIEIWQGVMPIGRSCDLLDALADAVGTVVGIGLAWAVAKSIKS